MCLLDRLLITKDEGSENNQLMVRSQKIKPWMLKKELLVLYYGVRDPRSGIWPKLIALLSVFYLLSPLDLIPDFIPFFGWLDDLVLVPLLLNLSIKLLPDNIREESLSKATGSLKKFKGLATIVIVLLAGLLLYFLARPLLNNR